jgi:hypothetical protein
MKHIETLPYNDARIMVDSGLEHLAIEYADLASTVDCYFCPVSGNLWHCYLGNMTFTTCLRQQLLLN